MDDAHLTPERLRRLIEEGGSEEFYRLLLHHLAVCPGCYAAGGYLLDLFRSGALGPQLSTIDVDLARSRAEAPGLFEKLRRYSPERQRSLIRDATRFRSWGLAEYLSKKSQEAAARDAREALELAEFAVEIADALEEWQPAEDLWLFELRAYTRATLANARRVEGDLRGAAAALREADKWWQAGAKSAGDVLGYEAQILALKSSLRLTEGRLPEALALLDQALQAEPDPPLRAAIGISRARVFEEGGNLEAAIRELANLSTSIDPEREPRLFLCARHNLLWLLATAGRAEEARALLPEVRNLSERLGNDLDLLRLRWAEARIAVARGELEEALGILASIREAFARKSIGYDAALAALELATLALRLDRYSDVRATAREIVPLFAAQDLHREAIAALTLFIQAAEAGEADLDFLDRLTAYLRRARGNPALVFRKDI